MVLLCIVPNQLCVVNLLPRSEENLTQEKPWCNRTCKLRYFPGVLVGARVGAIYYVLLGLYRYHRGRVDGDFAARLAHAAGTLNADMDGLKGTTCGEA